DTPVKLMQGFHYQEGSFLWIVNNIFFQYYSIIILLVSAIVMIAVSYASEAPVYDKISGLTYATRTEEDKKISRASWNATDVLLSVVVMTLILAAYIYFTG
ncbi:MAG: Na+/glucose cotransporter, partial [Ignavibacteriales bacterium]|nr:Na+/glucose cotransporter [Ignavibacteriales bacterium]